MSKQFSGKSVVVTGSTSGIGLGIARAFAGEGANVMLNGFGDAKEIESIRSGLAAEHAVTVAYSAADMSKPAEIVAMIADAQQALGAVDILVNNAGIQFVAPVDEFPPEKWDAIIAINLSSVFHGTRAAIPGMKAKNWGRIINIASAHGLAPVPIDEERQDQPDEGERNPEQVQGEIELVLVPLEPVQPGALGQAH